MSKLDWVRDLVRAEQQLEESDMVDFSVGFDEQKLLEDESIAFLERLKEEFVEYASAFNQMKGLSVGNIKIYGIANTRADFMLFRNGLKLIFSILKPGTISVKMNYGGYFPAKMSAGSTASEEEELIESQWGAFNELFWCYRKVRLSGNDHMVRFYLSRFIHESAK